jgi:hypothetical protein
MNNSNVKKKQNVIKKYSILRTKYVTLTIIFEKSKKENFIFWNVKMELMPN